jgi:hypothetical protein
MSEWMGNTIYLESVTGPEMTENREGGITQAMDSSFAG